VAGAAVDLACVGLVEGEVGGGGEAPVEVEGAQEVGVGGVEAPPDGDLLVLSQFVWSTRFKTSLTEVRKSSAGLYHETRRRKHFLTFEYF